MVVKYAQPKISHFIACKKTTTLDDDIDLTCTLLFKWNTGDYGTLLQ